MWNIRKYYNSQDVEDIIQDGMIGLIKAANNWKSEMGFKFSTYAKPCIDGAFNNWIIKNAKYKGLHTIKNTKKHLAIWDGYDYEENLEQSIEVFTEELDNKLDVKNMMKEYIKYYGTDEVKKKSCVKEITIICMIFGIINDVPMKLEQVGCLLGNCRERIRQIQEKAFIKFRKLPSVRKSCGYWWLQ